MIRLKPTNVLDLEGDEAIIKLTNVLDLEGDETIINKDVAAGLHHLGDVLVVQPQGLLITVVHVFVIQGQLDGVALLKFDLLGATLNNRGHS